MISIFLLFFLIRNTDKVARYIYAFSIWTLICFLMTEILSVFYAISTKNLWICWICLDMLLFTLSVIQFRRLGCKVYKGIALDGIKVKRFILWGLFSIIMLILAVKAVPYNWDSMTYHLPRIFHWYQNGSVDFYATSNDRQLSSPVGGAYIVLHVYAMAGGSDRFVALPQCLAYLTNGVLIYHIARKIGCSRKYCNLAVLLFYSMPIALAEAFTTQVDNVAALWMLATVYLLLDLLQDENRIALERCTLVRIIMMSLCVAFGYLTKPSIGIGLLIFAIWLLLTVIKRKDNVKPIIIYLLIAGVILAILLMPGFYRNLVTFDALSAPGVGKRQLVGTLDPLELLVNCIKNITFNMPAVWVYNSSEFLYNGVMAFAKLLGVDINNPAISEDGREFEVHNPQTYGHDTAVNPTIVYLLLFCIILWIIKDRKNHLDEFTFRNRYFIVAALSFISFCAMLRWEPFVSRYMISYLALLCPAIVGQLEMFFEETNNEERKLLWIGGKAIIIFLCVTELFGVLYNHGQAALSSSRYRGYFASRRWIEESYRMLADTVNDKGYEKIGILIGGDAYEYPLTVMLNGYSRIEHVNVTNETSIYEDADYVPDVIISIESGLQEDSIECNGRKYTITNAIDEEIYILE